MTVLLYIVMNSIGQKIEVWKRVQSSDISVKITISFLYNYSHDPGIQILLCNCLALAQSLFTKVFFGTKFAI